MTEEGPQNRHVSDKNSMNDGRFISVAAFHAIIDIDVRNRTERLVVEARQVHGFAQIFLKILDLFELVRLGWFGLAAWRGEELLKSFVGQSADFLAHHNPGTLDELHSAIRSRRFHNRGDSVAFDAGLATGHGLGLETSGAGGAHLIFECQMLRALTAKEHRLNSL